MNELRLQLVASLRPQDIEALSDDVVLALAHRLGAYLSWTMPAAEADGWLDFEGALEHLGMKKGALYKLTSTRTIPFHQDGPGCKLWFLRSELDEWRLNAGGRRTRSAHLRAA